MKQKRERQTTEHWDMEPAEAALKAMKYFAKQHTDGSDLKKPKANNRTTLVMKAHNPSTKKIRQLLETHVHVTNLTADIVDQWQEDPDKPRTDGALAECIAVQARGTFGRFRSRVLSGSLEKQFEPQHSESIILPRIRLGAYKDVAQMYVRTVSELGTRILKDMPEDTSLDLPTFYNHWKRIREAHQRATETVLALSMDPGASYRPSHQKLFRRTKHEARRLLTNLRSEPKIRKALAAVDALLEQRQDDGATYTTHLYKKNERSRRSIRQNWLLQYADSLDDRSVVLGSLERNELEDYRIQLLEMLSILEQAQQGVQAAQRSKSTHAGNSLSIENDRAEAHTSKPNTEVVDQVRSELETFLFDRPASFPTVQRVAIIDAPGSRLGWRVCDAEAIKGKRVEACTSEQLAKAYDESVEWFQYYWHSSHNVDRFSSADQEAEAIQHMFAAIRHLKPPRLRPITCVGSMSPVKVVDGKTKSAQYRDCALLFEEPVINEVKTTRFVFAALLQKQQEVQESELREGERRAKQLAKYQKRRSTSPLYFVNAPYTPFHIPSSHDLLLLPLECGQNYADTLLEIIKQQREGQQAAHEAAKQVPIERCIPAHTPFKSSRITCRWNEHDEPEFYVHLHLALQEQIRAESSSTEYEYSPPTYLGVTLREGRPAYSIVALDGTVLRVADIYIPPSVDPEENARRVSDNLLHWIANSIIARAVAWNSIIGIEDTSRISNAHNESNNNPRAPFELPLKRLFQMVKYKAQREELLAPRLVSNVSPTGDCSTCQSRFASSTTTTLIGRTSKCDSCYQYSMKSLVPNAPEYHSCEHQVSFNAPESLLEQWFICPNCQKPMLARHNRATVTAKRTSLDLVRHAANSHAKKNKRLKEENKRADAEATGRV